jgi:4,5-dihydroxyphthalate decarboxylase
MPNLRPTIAVSSYDRTRPLFDGRVTVDGCEPVWEWEMPIETMFQRALDDAAFEVSELSFSNFIRLTATGNCHYVGLPIFPSRSFRYGAWFVRKDTKIRTPQDLRGLTVGVREYSMTAAVVARGMLSDEFGVDAKDIKWIVGDVEENERESIALPALSKEIPIATAAKGALLVDLLVDGTIDCLLAYKPPKLLKKRGGTIKRLFDDYSAAEKEYARRTAIFPIMHLLGIRRDVASAEPWLGLALQSAFTSAKDIAMSDLKVVQALKIGLPWVASAVEETEEILGPDYWPYGVQRNLAAITTMARWHYEQGLSPAPLRPEQMFMETLMGT